MSRLTAFLKLLTVREDQASARAADATRATLAAQADLDGRRASYHTRPRQQGTLTAVQLLALQLQGVGALEHVEAAQAALDRRRQEQADAEDARSAAAVRRKSVERVTDRRKEQAAHVAQTAARRSLDELAILRKVAPRASAPAAGKPFG